MFTGIIEQTGIVTDIIRSGTNMDIWVESAIAPELKIDQSVAHNGVCLTIVEIQGTKHRVTAVAETLSKTNLNKWKTGDIVNIERCLRVGDRLDGHFVQGHVDAVAACAGKETLEGSWLFHFRFPAQFASLVIEKGSACINGVSLTVFNVTKDTFTVTIIPYTYEHTNFSQIEVGSEVNIEFDVLGKYLLRHQQLTSQYS
jgi:riboflavin synthase